MRKEGAAFAARIATLTPISGSQLVLVTQYFDTLRSIGESNKTNTLFLSHNPGAVKEISDQILESMLVAERAKG